MVLRGHCLRCATVAAVLVGCSFRHGALPSDATGVHDGDTQGDGAGGDATTDAASCTFSAWNAPQPITELNTPGLDARPRLSPDERTITFYSDRGGNRDIYTATRTNLGDAFSQPMLVGGVNSSLQDRDPAQTPNGLQIFFASDRNGNLDIFTATRASTSAVFTGVSSIAALNTPNNDYFLSLSHDGLELYFAANRAGGSGTHDIWYSKRGSVTDSFDNPMLLPGVSSASESDHCTAMRADRLELYVSQTLGGEIDIFVATRATTTAPFSTPTRVAELSFTGEDHPGWLSPDGLRFYYSNQSTGGSDLYMATRTCD